MTKLYRLVPDAISTITTTGYISSITEDLFYNLGYVSIPSDQYFGLYQEETEMVSEKNDGIFFFHSPWACIIGLNFIKDEYHGSAARILEYEIPDEVINLCNEAFTNYVNYQAKGVMIPLELMKNNEDVISQVSTDLKDKLERMAIQNSLSTIQELRKSNEVPPLHYDKLLEKESRINNRRFKKDEKYFKSSFITSRTMIISKSDYSTMISIENNTAVDDSTLDYIIDKSNGILSLDNYNSYKQNETSHQYGLILS